MTEGTKSYLFGCHNFFFHPLFVLVAWRHTFHEWPNWWELFCIIVHDVGIIGRDYLKDDTAKKGHWIKGTQISLKWITKLSGDWNLGREAAAMCAGHTMTSGVKISKLYWADKWSWWYAWTWWMWTNYWIENWADMHITKPKEFKKKIYIMLTSKIITDAHDVYLSERHDLE